MLRKKPGALCDVSQVVPEKTGIRIQKREEKSTTVCSEKAPKKHPGKTPREFRRSFEGVPKRSSDRPRSVTIRERNPMKRLMEKLKEKIKNFFRWIWQECRDVHTLILFAVVVILMYFPVWGGYLFSFLFDLGWCSVVASAYMLFWAGPFTPFFPLCIAITLSLKKAFEVRKRKKEDSGKKPAEPPQDLSGTSEKADPDDKKQ